jgi:hypothetical protein
MQSPVTPVSFAVFEIAARYPAWFLEWASYLLAVGHHPDAER